MKRATYEPQNLDRGLRAVTGASTKAVPPGVSATVDSPTMRLPYSPSTHSSNCKLGLSKSRPTVKIVSGCDGGGGSKFGTGLHLVKLFNEIKKSQFKSNEYRVLWGRHVPWKTFSHETCGFALVRFSRTQRVGAWVVESWRHQHNTSSTSRHSY